MSRLAVAALLAVTLGACAEGGATFLRNTPLFYPTAQRNYDQGQKELKSGNWMAAIQYFQHIRNNFGFSKLATLAELGIADANLGRERYTEAIDGYKDFIKAHPGHERTQDGYAAFKIGECYHAQIPGDFFIMPPSYEKDQGPILDALRELQNFVEQYADSPYVEKAKKFIAECIGRLADHELYVARFYLDLDKPYAAIGRLEGVLRDYPGAQREPECLLLLGKTYLAMKKNERAREIFLKLTVDHASDFRAERARRYIEFIDKQRK